MPEGDLVWRVCRRLNDALAGETLTRCEFRVPSLATTDFSGVAVREVAARGKHQLTRFDNGYTLHTHLRMEGSWQIVSASDRLPAGTDFRLRVILGVPQRVALGFLLGMVDVVPTAEEDQLIGHLGPDLLGSDWDLDEAVHRLGSEPQRAIGEALLDQRNLAGIGTFYRAEVLYLSGIHPRTAAGRVPDLARLCRLAHRLLLANRDRVQQVTTGDLRPGRGSYVFGRAGKPCRRCGSRIAFEEFGPAGQERTSYWCPRCQPSR